MNKMKPIEHPAKQKGLQSIVDRFMRLRGEHQKAQMAMWAGMLATEFSDAELDQLTDYLCPNDQRQMAKIRLIRRPTLLQAGVQRAEWKK